MRPSTFKHLVILHVFIWEVCTQKCDTKVCHDVCLEVRRQFVGVSSFQRVPARNQTQGARLGGKHLYLLNHLAG